MSNIFRSVLPLPGSPAPFPVFVTGISPGSSPKVLILLIYSSDYLGPHSGAKTQMLVKLGSEADCHISVRQQGHHFDRHMNHK